MVGHLINLIDKTVVGDDGRNGRPGDLEGGAAMHLLRHPAIRTTAELEDGVDEGSLDGDEDPELIDTIYPTEPILSVADVLLHEHDLTLVRSSVTHTVSGELDEPEPDELDDDEDADDDSETYELLVSFLVDDLEYGLYIPLDPFFVVARMNGDGALLVEGEEFERVQPRIEAELEEREGDD